jgi:HPt (histidine-containing phosphotransfer) domain-containing protein
MTAHDDHTLDTRQLRDATGADAEFERLLLSEYLDQAEAILARLADAVCTRNAGAIRSAAHELKGSSRTIGAARVADAAQMLETIGTSGELGAVEHAHAALRHAYDRLRIAIHEHVRKAA